MTAEQDGLLIQYANDFRSALCAYEDDYGVLDLENKPLADIVEAGAKMSHLIESLETVRSIEDQDPS